MHITLKTITSHHFMCCITNITFTMCSKKLLFFNNQNRYSHLFVSATLFNTCEDLFCHNEILICLHMQLLFYTLKKTVFAYKPCKSWEVHFYVLFWAYWSITSFYLVMVLFGMIFRWIGKAETMFHESDWIVLLTFLIRFHKIGKFKSNFFALSKYPNFGSEGVIYGKQ